MENRCAAGSWAPEARGEVKLMATNGKAVMENVRRYRAIASLYRQTAAFRPLQSWSLLGQAEEWERLALAELEAYFSSCDSRTYDLRWEVPGKIAGFGGLACA